MSIGTNNWDIEIYRNKLQKNLSFLPLLQLSNQDEKNFTPMNVGNGILHLFAFEMSVRLDMVAMNS